jgi:hypothetical protein
MLASAGSTHPFNLLRVVLHQIASFCDIAFVSTAHDDEASFLSSNIAA